MNSTLPTALPPRKTGFQPEARRWREERRVSHRVPCRVKSADQVSPKICLVGHTVNLSATGLAVQLGRPLKVGADVDVLLPQLDGEPTRMRGFVMHCRRVLAGTYELGVRIGPDEAMDC